MIAVDAPVLIELLTDGPRADGEAGEQLLEVVEQALARVRPRQDRTFGEADRAVGDEEVGIHRHAGSESGALGTRAERGVERKGARLDLGEAKSMLVRATHFFAEDARLAAVAVLIDPRDDGLDGALEERVRQLCVPLLALNRAHWPSDRFHP